MPLKFTEPTPTKSGERVSVLWNELLECQVNVKTGRLNGDRLVILVNAMRIMEIQDDLGIPIESYHEVEATR